MTTRQTNDLSAPCRCRSIRAIIITAVLLFTCTVLFGAQPDDRPAGNDSPPLFFSGFFSQASAGFLAGKSDHGDPASLPAFSILAASRVSPRFSLGLGTGMDLLEYMAAPVYGNIHMHLQVDRTYHPYLFFRSGYSFPLGKANDEPVYKFDRLGGYMLGTGAGILLPGDDHIRFYLQAGYRYQELRTDRTHTDTGVVVNYSTFYNRLELTIGVFFR